MFQLAIEIVSSARTEDADTRKEPATMATMSGANTSRNKRAYRMFHLMNMNGSTNGPRLTRPHAAQGGAVTDGRLRRISG